ncbi:O-antigen ligase family protein [Janthinobacterium sp. GB4P2]|uniref:O-antigen ligase family protein n=1 Tax=Janthinobacterium sp. GB4P2 TaxID=3424189 RepID=UPI003F29D052
MAIVGYAGSRLGEIAIMVCLFPAVFQSLLVKKNFIYFILIILLLLTSASIGKENIFWTFKICIFLAYASAMRFIITRNILAGMFGMLCGWNLYAFFMVLTGSSFLAKYVLPHLCLFIIAAFFYDAIKSVLYRNIACLFSVMAFFVAISSNSRGQILLTIVAGIFCFLYFMRVRIKYLIFGIFMFPLIYIAVGLYNYLHLASLLQGADGLAQVNAGDLERSTTIFYSISMLPQNLFGQNIDNIKIGMGSYLNLLIDAEIQTISAHNILSDSLLYIGIVGGALMLFIYKRFLQLANRALSQIKRTKLAATGLSALVAVGYIISTSPVAGLERVEILYCITLFWYAFFEVKNNISEK